MYFRDHSWEEIIPRLLLYAAKKTRKLYWQGRLNGHLPGGREAHDIVHRAIEKVLSARRKWDPQKQPDLYRFLCSVVDSEINHLARGWDNRRLRCASSLSSANGCDENPPANPSAQLEERNPSQEDAEEKLIRKIYFEEFEKSLKNDPQLQSYLRLWKLGYTPTQIAAFLQIELRKVYSLRGRLKRLESEYRAGLSRKPKKQAGGGES